jgi:hypothetical protein
VSRIVEVQNALNLFKDSNSIVLDGHGHSGNGSLDYYRDTFSLGMVNHVIEHFSETVFADSDDVLANAGQKGQYSLAPDAVFLKILADRQSERFVGDWAKDVFSAFRLAFGRYDLFLD